MNILFVSPEKKICKPPNLQNMLRWISLKIVALILLLNVCYLMFVVCNIGPSDLIRSDVTLI
jgi:hypothetical protein